MSKLELQFRQKLIADMGGRWIAAIHRENNLNPGVPDLSYLMVGPGHELGWLELKAVMRRKKTGLGVKIESSQHQWMIKYAHRVPTHFLILVTDKIYLIDGIHHAKIVPETTEDGLVRLAMVVKTKDTIAELTKILSELTRRDRNHGHARVWGHQTGDDDQGGTGCPT